MNAKTKNKVFLSLAMILMIAVMAGGLVSCAPSNTNQQPNEQGTGAQDMASSIFDLAIVNRFDYVPEFEAGAAPTGASEYLYYAFALNLESWNQGNHYLTKEYVEDVIKTHFEVASVQHGPARDWDFDQERYTVARAGSYRTEPVYGLKAWSMREQDKRNVYDVVLDEYSFDEFAYTSVFEYTLPDEQTDCFAPMQFVIEKKGDLIKSGKLTVWQAIREMIKEGDVSGFSVARTEKFSFAFNDDNQIIFISHTEA